MDAQQIIDDMHNIADILSFIDDALASDDAEPVTLSPTGKYGLRHIVNYCDAELRNAALQLSEQARALRAPI